MTIQKKLLAFVVALKSLLLQTVAWRKFNSYLSAHTHHQFTFLYGGLLSCKTLYLHKQSSVMRAPNMPYSSNVL